VVLALLVGETVLDAGCGVGRWGALIRSNYWEAGLAAPPAVDGFDAFEPNVELCRSGGAYRSVWQQQLPSPLEGSWDTVLACELVEHLEQDAVAEAVAVLEAAARRRVVFTTPNAPDFRGGSDTVAGFNEFEAHRAYVSRSFFRSRGYTLRGAGFGRPGGRIAPRVKRLAGSQTLNSLSFAVPALGESIVAYKDTQIR
jgi:SAM-dependent methyltransferase